MIKTQADLTMIKTVIKVKSLHRHPVKSLRGQAVSTAKITPNGLAGDRQFMLVDADGKFVTARTTPKLLTLVPDVADGKISITDATGDVFSCSATPSTDPTVDVKVWGDDINGADLGDGAAAWLSSAIGKQVRLLAVADASVRRGPMRGTPKSFADMAPLLLFSTASLDDLNSKLDKPLGLESFRPNIVLEGVDKAFDEDFWGVIKIGEVEMEVAWGCGRCVLTTLDPMTGAKSKSQEPIRSLNAYRRGPDNQVYFGQNVIPLSSGTIRVGDVVEVLSRKERPFYMEDVYMEDVRP